LTCQRIARLAIAGDAALFAAGELAEPVEVVAWERPVDVCSAALMTPKFTVV
jgi:hypothetical protein